MITRISVDAEQLDEGDLLADAELDGTVPVGTWIGDEAATTSSY